MSASQVATGSPYTGGLSEQVAHVLSERIIEGELPPGAYLPPEPQLAEEFGVSRTVVREATRVLVAKGLVEVQRGRGVLVRKPATEETVAIAFSWLLRQRSVTFWHLWQMRVILETEVAGLAAQPASRTDVAIVPRVDLADRASVEALLALPVATRQGPAPLGRFVRVEEGTRPGSRHRKNLRPVVYVTGDVAGEVESPVYAILAMNRALDTVRVDGRPAGVRVAAGKTSGRSDRAFRISVLQEEGGATSPVHTGSPSSQLAATVPSTARSGVSSGRWSQRRNTSSVLSSAAGGTGRIGRSCGSPRKNGFAPWE